jgi:hypothetical protein
MTNIYIKYQFERAKRLLQITFETLKYILRLIILVKIKHFAFTKVAQNVTIYLG